MRNPKSQTTRKVRSAQATVRPTRRTSTTCHPVAENVSSEPESRNTQHATRLNPSINPLIHQSNNPSSARTRNGKVARLPYAVRDMINRMLRNNIPHSQIVAALDELQFKVTERNISNWKTRGGYRDWCIAQDRALETRLLQDNLLEHLRKNDASQFAEVGLQLAATQLSQFFLKSETREQLTAEPEKFARTIGILCRLARQIHILQKYRDQSAKELGPEHNSKLSKRETDETLERTRDVYSSFIPDNAPIEPEVPHRNFLPKNGYPADPPQDDPPPDNTEFHHRNFQKLCDIIAARNAEAQSPPQTPFPGSAARSASSDSSPEPEHSDDATPQTPNPHPHDPA